MEWESKFEDEDEDDEDDEDEEEDFEEDAYYEEGVFENNHEYVISVNLSGVDKKNIIVDAVNGGILVKAMKIAKDERVDEERGEYSYSKSLAGFSRLFGVSDDADKDNVNVKYKNGVLRTLQNCSKFSKRSLKERNLAFLEVANFAKRFIQTSLLIINIPKIKKFSVERRR